jgi:hypothetical protein
MAQWCLFLKWDVAALNSKPLDVKPVETARKSSESLNELCCKTTSPNLLNNPGYICLRNRILPQKKVDHGFRYTVVGHHPSPSILGGQFQQIASKNVSTTQRLEERFTLASWPDEYAPFIPLPDALSNGIEREG